MRGNVVDMAVGIIIGAAFSKIVSSLVADVIMPPLSLLIGGIDFKQFTVVLRKPAGCACCCTELWHYSCKPSLISLSLRLLSSLPSKC